MVFKGAPNPNAGKLFQNWMHSREAQQFLVDWARQYSPHGQTVEKPGVRPLSDIKLMKEDAGRAWRRRAEEIKKRYAQIFQGVICLLYLSPLAGRGRRAKRVG